MMTPAMFKIEVEGKPYMDPVKKFTVSKDSVMAALVTNANQILVYKILDTDPQTGTCFFTSEKKFIKECRVFKHPLHYKDIIEIFIFTNANVKYGEGQYSMYTVCQNGVLMMYEGIDKKDSSNI